MYGILDPIMYSITLYYLTLPDVRARESALHPNAHLSHS
jgi:hypothetical protein